jgi:hypothetical protein
MMHNTLVFLFPDYKPNDWILQDDIDGIGPYIKQWNRPEPQPTQADIDAAAPLAQAKMEKDASNAQVLAEIAAEEAKQGRAIREHLLGDATALPRLKAIDDNIKAARLRLKK